MEARGDEVLITHYADLLKYVCEKFFGWDGNKDEFGRSLLQYVGTNKVRAAIPTFWVDFIVKILSIFRNEWDYVIIPDCRFINEYEIPDQYWNTILVRVVRDGNYSELTSEQQQHISEIELDNYPCYDIIYNNQGLDDLKQSVSNFVRTRLDILFGDD